VTFEGHFGGPTYATAVSGNYAYVGQGQDLVVLDVSNPSQLLELGRIYTLGLVYDIKIIIAISSKRLFPLLVT